MQKFWLIFVSSLAISLHPLSLRAADFEGVLHMAITHVPTNSASTMDWYLRGDKARVEMSGGAGQTNVMIFNAQTRTMQMAMAGQKTYIEMNMGGERGEHLTEALEQQAVQRTGKIDKIAGYSCEIWQVTDKQRNRLKNDMCVAKGFGKAASFWVDPKEMKRSSQPSWVKQLVDEGGFGLRSIHYDEAGKESLRMEVTSIEKKPLDANLFAFPSDWVKQDMSGMQDRMKATREQKRRDGEDFTKLMEQMKKRKAASSNAREVPGENAEAQPDMNDMMKQFGEMMKKQQQPQSGQ